jgi:hypothetical protein
MGLKNLDATMIQTPDQRKLSTTCSHTKDNTHTSGFILIYEMKLVILLQENIVSSQVQGYTLLNFFIMTGYSL